MVPIAHVGQREHAQDVAPGSVLQAVSMAHGRLRGTYWSMPLVSPWRPARSCARPRAASLMARGAQQGAAYQAGSAWTSVAVSIWMVLWSIPRAARTSCSRHRTS